MRRGTFAHRSGSACRIEGAPTCPGSFSRIPHGQCAPPIEESAESAIVLIRAPSGTGSPRATILRTGEAPQFLPCAGTRSNLQSALHPLHSVGKSPRLRQRLLRPIRFIEASRAAAHSPVLKRLLRLVQLPLPPSRMFGLHHLPHSAPGRRSSRMPEPCPYPPAII